MYGGGGKHGRGGGGGRGAGKRNIASTFHAPPLHRPSSSAPGGRRSTGTMASGPRAAATTASAKAPSTTTAEESFSLITGNPLNFAMIIRLAPDLVEEIKRTEAQGDSARIKFDANANNSSGNVISVGAKDFHFTWSREMGDLCDIYEERESGEDGNGLLVESGGAWRKLNVQRILDESTTKHVKMRSVEAERKHKSRKAIVLDHENPSMKKALAAAEANPWRQQFKQKKEPPFKKRKAEQLEVVGPPRAAYKSGVSATSSKGRPSASPSLEQSGMQMSPFGSGIYTKAQKSVENALGAQCIDKTVTLEKEIPSRVIDAARDKPGHNRNLEGKPTDVRSFLIGLLAENHSKGMSFKALEKAVGDSFPNSLKQIEPIIKKVAIFQAPGRYFLKPEVETERFRKPLSQSGSSPEDNRSHPSSTPDKFDQLPVPEPSPSMRVEAMENLEEEGRSNSKAGEPSNAFEEIDILSQSPITFEEKKTSDNNEGPAGSSSESGSDSDSDSDSSDTGSDSGSPSRSRSPAGSGSPSSSDSETDASSNSKEASDEDVDIMTSDDDKESNKQKASVPGSSRSPVQWTSPAAEPFNENQDNIVTSMVLDIEKDLPDDDQMVEVVDVDNSDNSVPDEEVERTKEDIEPSPDSGHQESQVHAGQIMREPENVTEDRLKGSSDEKHVDYESDNADKPRSLDQSQPPVFGARSSFSVQSPRNLSPDRPVDSTHIRTPHKFPMDGPHQFGLQKVLDQTTFGKSTFDSQQQVRRSVDLNAQPMPLTSGDRTGRHDDSFGRSRHQSERTIQMNENFPMQKERENKYLKDGGDSNNGKMSTKISKGDVGIKHPRPIDSHYRKHEVFGKSKGAGSVSNSQPEYGPKQSDITAMERSPMMNGKGNKLQRELSDLELGELREPLAEETSDSRRPFERKGAFKAENRRTSSEYWNSGSSNGKASGKMSADSKNLSPPNLNIPVHDNPEGSSKKGTPEPHAEDSAKTHGRQMQHQPQQQNFRIEHTEPGIRNNKKMEVISRNGVSAGSGAKVNRNNQIKGSIALQQQGTKRGAEPILKEKKRQKSELASDVSDRPKDTSLTGSNDGLQKKREWSPDENSNSYSKYEKEGPELKAPIKDMPQYADYVLEFNEKYKAYISLIKVLDSYSDEFSKYGREIEASKDKDLKKYNETLRQIEESYRRCGERYKRLKKIFLVLYEELRHLKQMLKVFAASYTKD